MALEYFCSCTLLWKVRTLLLFCVFMVQNVLLQPSKLPCKGWAVKSTARLFSRVGGQCLIPWEGCLRVSTIIFKVSTDLTLLELVVPLAGDPSHLPKLIPFGGTGRNLSFQFGQVLRAPSHYWALCCLWLGVNVGNPLCCTVPAHAPPAPAGILTQ